MICRRLVLNGNTVKSKFRRRSRKRNFMAKTIQQANELAPEQANQPQPDMDSKYRLIIVAAQRSKQIQRGARPRVQMDAQKHKPTRIALEEVLSGQVGFEIVKQ